MIMKGQSKNLKDLVIDKSWTLFLDRDGVINKKIDGDYVRSWKQFKFLPNVLDALKTLDGIFGKIIIVTNQRGIGIGLMTEEDLKEIHEMMLGKFKRNGIRIDSIYYCPHDYEKEICNCRKPAPGMALQAKKDFPNIDFRRSVSVGDSFSDIEFGKNLGMITVLLTNHEFDNCFADFCFRDLFDFSKALEEISNTI